jgi:hypothetical protein
MRRNQRLTGLVNDQPGKQAGGRNVGGTPLPGYVAVEPGLHGIPCRAIDDRLMLALVAHLTVRDLTDVDRAFQDRVDLPAAERDATIGPAT